jgi:outer membrane protein
MLFRNIILLFLILPGIASAQMTGDSLTLSQTIHLVIENHPAIHQGLAGIAVAEAQMEQNRSAYYPDISAAGTYTRLDPVSTFELPGLGAEELVPRNNYNANLAIKETIFDFGRRARSLELAQSSKSSASENVESLKSNLAYQIVDIFYAILYLRENLTVLDSEIVALNQHLEITRKRVSAGAATDFEILTTQVRIANSASQRLDIVNSLQIQEASFRQLTGLGTDTPINLNGNFGAPEISLDTDSLISIAYEQLPEMKIAWIAENSASLQERLAALGDRPSLGLNISLGYKNGYTPDINDLRANWAATIAIQVPIFNGFLTRGKVQQAHANFQAAQYRIDDLKRRVVTGIEQAISSLRTSQSKLETAEPQITQAEQAVALAHIRYTAGTATNLDLLDAETALANARLIRLKAMFELARSGYGLKRATGVKIWE